MPILGVIGVLLIPKENTTAMKWWALINNIITFALTIALYCSFDQSIPGIQMAVKIPWIPQFHINYALGIDGISLPMILLTSLLFMLCILSSWTQIKKSLKGYFALLLLLQSTVFGVFMALDFFLFYVYWEVMLLPMFFLIGVWGGENREYAAVKFFLYTFFGSLLMLVGIVALYFATGQSENSFSILALQGGHFTNLTLNLFGASLSFSKLFFIFMFV